MSAEMRLDVRIPIGGMFTVIGGLLAIYGLVSDKAMYSRSLDININLWWGLAMLVFGVLMLMLARRAAQETKQAEEARKRTGGPEAGLIK
jgi:hypothetical protein